MLGCLGPERAEARELAAAAVGSSLADLAGRWVLSLGTQADPGIQGLPVQDGAWSFFRN